MPRPKKTVKAAPEATPAAKVVEGSQATQFQPGQSGNPGGRPKGFATKIKELCGDDYEKIAKGLYLIAFGKASERREFFGDDKMRVTTRDRIAAAVALRDSGPGRPVQALEHRGDVPAATRIIHQYANDDEAAAALEDESHEAETA